MVSKKFIDNWSVQFIDPSLLHTQISNNGSSSIWLYVLAKSGYWAFRKNRTKPRQAVCVKFQRVSKQVFKDFSYLVTFKMATDTLTSVEIH